MEITKDNNGRKWIRAAYKQYLVSNAQAEDKDKLVAHSVLVPDWVRTDEWTEATEDEVQRIRTAKQQSDKVEYPEEITQTMSLMRMKINDMGLTDAQALAVKSLHPAWDEFIGQSLAAGMRVTYGEALYKVRQDIAVVLENQPPSADTAALYEEVCEAHAGTAADPIPYNNNMALDEGKYYAQGGVVYLCVRSTGQAVYNPLAELVGNYVEPAEADASL